VRRDRLERMTATAADGAVERLLRALPERHALSGGDPEDPLARAVLSGRSQLLGEDAAGALGPAGREAAASGALRRHRPRAAMVVPLRARGRAVGVLSLVALAGERPFGAEELSLAEDVARRAALALDNAALYEQQRDVARVLQDSLLPDRLPRLDGLELAARYRPAGDGLEIGGDFFDVFPIAGGATGLSIGDVTGKGARAAALTGLTKYTLRTAGAYEREPGALLAVLNRALLAARGEGGRYCTVVLCALRPGATGTHVRLAVAGHPLPFVVRADGEVDHVGRSGTLLGYVEDPELREDDVHLGPGDALVLYTDGVTGATPAGPVLDHRLRELLRSAVGADAEALAGRVEAAAVDAQDGRPRDDVAVAVVRAEPDPAAT
jgi:serine phosphatase RsbU (regulator of sigma subunit)